MEYIKLSNGVEMPMIGLGVLGMGGRTCEKAVRDAIDIGYRMIDTAAIYGNESAVGRGIKESHIDREDIFITTKLWVSDANYESVRKAFKKSLRNLQVDYIDLYLIHQPLGDVYGAWRAMEELYEEGRVRAIGVSNMNSGRLVDLILHNRIAPHVNQVEIHPFYQQEKALSIMKQYDVQPEGWAPFAEGRNNIFHNETLEKIAKKYGKTVAQVILRWNIERGIVTVPKSSHIERIKENFDIWDFELTKDEIDSIKTLDLGKEMFFEHDSPEVARMFGSYKLWF